MNRINNLYEKIYSIENLQLADVNARKGKGSQYGIMIHDKSKKSNIERLHVMLKQKTYTTSAYTTFKIYEPKEREVYRLPYFPDRIAHHAIMNILQPVFVSTFTTNTYSCIKGRGIHAASYALRKALLDIPNTQYCLKIDVKKFYPSINHAVLKQLLRRKFKDKDLLWLLDGIIDSAPGLPIGNYLSQYLANFYLTYFDHFIKQDLSVKNYFRYADDIVVLAGTKPYLHSILADMKNYLTKNLKLTVKDNYQIFPVAARGIDFVGYRTFHTHVLLRKGIKKNFARMLKYRNNNASIASYNGWAKHANTKHLLKKLLHEKV